MMIFGRGKNEELEINFGCFTCAVMMIEIHRVRHTLNEHDKENGRAPFVAEQ